MPLGEVLFESGSRLNQVYFPVTAIVSLLYVMERCASAEIAVVGHEGIVGIYAFHGRRLDAQPRGRAECRPGLQAARKPPHEGVHRSGPVLHLLLRYTQAVISQMAQTAVCNRHHSLDQ